MLILKSILTKAKETSVKTGQTEAAVNAFRESSSSNIREENWDELTKKIETSTTFASFGKKLTANTDVLRKIQDQMQQLQKEDIEKKVDSFQEVEETEMVEKPFWQTEELTLKEFLNSDMGLEVKKMLSLMENPEMTQKEELETWWNVQKAKWTPKEKPKNWTTMYRAFSWWSMQFRMTLTNLLTDFMINPFANSLQELCHKAAFLRNALHAIGLIDKGEARVKWAETFIAMSK